MGSEFIGVAAMLTLSRLCVICIGPGHPVVVNAEDPVVSISFDLKQKRSENRPTGKRKKNAQWLDPKTKLCLITCKSGATYTLFG